MTVEYKLHDLGEGMTEAELLRWLVKVGDTLTLDQAVAEVQTDKAVVELPSPVAGTVLSLKVAEGQVVPVDTLLMLIDDGATKPVVASNAAASNGATGASIPAVALPPEQEKTAQGAAGPWNVASTAPQRRVLATPAVRRLARELRIDITAVQGSGPAGRVLAEDLHAFNTGALTSAVVTAPLEDEERAVIATALPTPAMQPTPEMEGSEEERLPLRGLRRRIAENMVLSYTTIPQVTSFVEVEVSRLVELRRTLVPLLGGHVKLSYLPFIIKAVVQALRAYPYVNACIDEKTQEIVLKRAYHIGIATATPDGLLVPVLRHADRLTIIEIAEQLNHLAEAGRERKLALEQLRGSTFTISNYGAGGFGYFAGPLINPGEAAILGLGRIADRPWVVDGKIEPRPVLPVAFTADHRLIDGDLAMRFMATLTSTLENPSLLMLEMR